MLKNYASINIEHVLPQNNEQIHTELKQIQKHHISKQRRNNTIINTFHEFNKLLTKSFNNTLKL